MRTSAMLSLIILQTFRNSVLSGTSLSLPRACLSLFDFSYRRDLFLTIKPRPARFALLAFKGRADCFGINLVCYPLKVEASQCYNLEKL